MDRQYAVVLWGALLGVPCLAVGAWTYVDDLPAAVSYPFLVLGAFALAVGVYVSSAAPEPGSYDAVEVYRPTSLPAYAYAVVAGVALVGALSLLYATALPYVWLGLTFVVFLLAFVEALVTYWRGKLTTYYVTPDRLVSEYRFLSLQRKSFEHEDVTDVARRQSILATLLGIGTVEVSVPGGTITLDDIPNPDDAEELLNRKRL